MNYESKKMNILFLSIGRLNSLKDSGLYTDLLRQFYKNGHQVYSVSPIEKRNKETTHIIQEEEGDILRVQTGNITKCNFIEKGISTLQIEKQFIKAIKKYYNNVKFDLILYSTPPITFAKVIEYVKKRDHARTYLLLKDIFPQNAVDLGLFGKHSPIYYFFRNKEKKLYRLSDTIGCMSQANVDYILKHNPEVDKNKVEICPNSIEPIDICIDQQEKSRIRDKYGIPKDKTVFVYGGNFGKPQGIDHIIKCLQECSDISDAFFLLVGSGTEFFKLERYVKNEKPENVKLLNQLPKEDYEILVNSCDVGLIFLDYRFTIPNFPSRLLSYMQASMPVLACTDKNTDIGKVIENGKFGYWCESKEPIDFKRKVEVLLKEKNLFSQMGCVAYQYLKNNYSVEKSYQVVFDKL